MITKIITNMIIKSLCSYPCKKTYKKACELVKGHIKRNLHFLLKRLQFTYWGATITTLLQRNLKKMEPRMLQRNVLAIIIALVTKKFVRQKRKFI